MKWIKSIVKVILGVSALFLFAFGISSFLVYYFDFNKHKDLIAEKFNEVTGQELKLNGPIEVKLLPLPYIELNNAELTLPYHDKKIHVLAQYVKMNINLSTILAVQKKVDHLEARNIFVNLIDQEKMVRSLTIDSFSGQLLTTCCDLVIPDFQLIAGKNDLRGELHVIYGDTYNIHGKVKAKQWEIPHLLMDPSRKAEKFMALEPADLDWLDYIKTKIDFKADNFVLKNLKLQNVDLNLAVENKNLTITHQAKSIYGNISGKLQIQNDKKTNRPSLTTQFVIKKSAQESLDGNLNFTFLKNATLVKGTLHSPRWLIDWFEKSEKNKFFSKDFFSVDWLNNLKGNIDYRIDNLFFQKLVLQKAILNFSLQDNLMIITPRGLLANGQFSGKFSLKRTARALPEVKGQYVLKDANASEFLKIFSKTATTSGGRLNLSFTGSSKGNTEAALMANLSGKLLLQIKDMTINNANIDARYVDFFAAFWKSLLSRKKNTLLECAVMRMNIQNGIAESKNAIGLETRELYSWGSGRLNLKTEQLDYEFTLAPRSKIDLEVGSYQNVLLLKGTLNNPQLTATPTGLIQEGGTILLGIATGGISLVAEKLFKLMADRGSPCKGVLSQGG